MRKSRALALALTTAALGLLAAASAAQALPASFWGVVPQAVPSEEQWLRLKRGGVESVRVPVDWAAVQPTRGGAFHWDEFDTYVERTADVGLNVLPFLMNAPRWAVPWAPVQGTGGSVKAPARLPVKGAAAGAWSRFVKAAVQRYGPGGAFWAENRGVPKRPIRVWQIWNEENFKYFVAHPNPAEYGQLVRISFAAARSVDPRAQIILGGMFARPKGGKAKGAPSPFAARFLAKMYQLTPGIKTKFSGVALHPYTNNYRELTPEIEEFRRVLAQNHDAGKGLWITELGWSSQPPPANPLENVFAKRVRGQARQLRGAFHVLVAKAAKWRLKRLYWFSVDDQAGSCNFCDGTGLFGSGFKPKPAWNEYVRFAGGTP